MGTEWQHRPWLGGGRAGGSVCAVQLGAVQFGPGRNIYGVQGARLNPLGLFLRTSTPCTWGMILGAGRPACTPCWLRGPASPRFPCHYRAETAAVAGRFINHDGAADCNALRNQRAGGNEYRLD